MRIQTPASLADMQSEAHIPRRNTEADAVWKPFPWKLLSCQHSFEMRYRAPAVEKRGRKMGREEKKMLEPRGRNKTRRARLRRRQGQRGDEAKLQWRATRSRPSHIRIQMSHLWRAQCADEKKNTQLCPATGLWEIYTAWQIETPT